MAILQDPVMQSILQQAKSDPAALQDHMKNADIRSKVSPQSIFIPLVVLTFYEDSEAGGCWGNSNTLIAHNKVVNEIRDSF